MCGFVGMISMNKDNLNIESRQIVKDMNEVIFHRGPDEEGYYFDNKINLGFRRLSIIDLEKGHQPLSFEDERYWIVFNGEIYNYIELREELKEEGLEFKTESDTEVVLACYSKYKKQVVTKLRGMFAFVVWDKKEEVFFAARDHFGIKPFYYAEENGCFYFSSEKKAILGAINEKNVNCIALQNYLTFQYAPGTDTMHNEIHELSPAHYIMKKKNEHICIKKYWNVVFTPMVEDQSVIERKIKRVLYDSVEKHMRSDVTVGSFLSGGLDSSIITSIAKEFNPNLMTFSVGFNREGYSEIDLAQETAKQLKVENISHVISAKEFMDEFSRFVYYMDDPLADPAAVAQFFLSKITSKYVKVALSGEGADELFGGYLIYGEPNSLKVFEGIPDCINKTLNKLAQIIPEGVKGRSFILRGTTPLEKRFVGNAKIFEEEEKKKILINYLEGNDYTKITKPFYDSCKLSSPVNRMQYIDIHTWLNGDLLLNADRTTMAHSLELRTPFVDREVFKVARKISSSLKISHGTTKYILREAVKDFVPQNILYRKKLGFPVPIGYWLRNEMYDWAKNIMINSQTDHLIDKSYVIKLLDKHYAGKGDFSRKIWTVITFMEWYRIFVDEDMALSKVITR
jgi:asparagine synthase (glutamine-hydrolysing)